ncbi:MAG TPA: asparagine synthase C-terminal domain-containing protein, partial [Thermoanaerobaculia bacterium]|nr:asparagine synthase C-terminal domain-containing protein [Thermoanaerobaculia bacterium]
VDPEALGDFLSYGYVPADRCVFRGIRKLPPGHILRRARGETTVYPFWDPERADVGGDAVEELRDLLRRAVRSHAVSDVPVGAFLSGGLDSTTVTALLREHAPEPVRTFTVAYRGGGQEDLRYAEIAARRFATRHTAEALTLADIGEDLDAIGTAFDEPVSDATSLAVFHLSRIAREQVKVVLSGDGGDEVFGGYGWHESSLAYEATRARLGPLLPILAWLDRALVGRLDALTWGTRAGGLRKLAAADPVDRYFALRGFFTKAERRSIFDPALSAEDPAWLFRRHYRTDLAPAARLCWLDLKTYLPDNNLALVDRASMAHGLEVRVPLLDRRLVEFALSLPDAELVRPGTTKILFRRAIGPWLPSAILDRRKYGFSPPFKQWVSRDGGKSALELLRGGALSRDGLLDVRAFERRIAAGMPRRWNKLWLLVVAERWYRRWIAGAAQVDGAARAAA